MATKLQTLATFWQNFGLSNVQKSLDEVASEITTRQDESDTSLFALIELLREFKKSNNDEVKQSVAPVVKSFQNEVDSLAKRYVTIRRSDFHIILESGKSFPERFPKQMENFPTFRKKAVLYA